MNTAALNINQRKESLTAMSETELDILVVGGGVTGAGIAYDAALRGLKVGIVDSQDWASGTSSRSSKLVHGGLRYLYQLNFKLVHEALTERGLLLDHIAPHLVHAVPLLWPFKMPVIERSYSTVGVGMYDLMAQMAHRGSVPIQRHLSKDTALKTSPCLAKDSLCGAMVYYDARVDDARLTLTLMRSAIEHGAYAANRVALSEVKKNEAGRVDTAILTDGETGETYEVRARNVIVAAGVWTEETQKLSGAENGLKVLASKGIHIIVPKERIKSETGMFLRTEKSVLFIIPWKRYWVIGTTDTTYNLDLKHPVANATDIDYLLEQCNKVFAEPLTRDDVIGSYAGLRPLLQPVAKKNAASTKVSREHTVTEVCPGMISIAGGKLTTYRVMAKDAVDFALGDKAKSNPCTTHEVPIRGAVGYKELMAKRSELATEYGISESHVEDLLDRYGSDVDLLFAMIKERSDLAQELGGAEAYLRAEIAFAVTHEGALHLEDVLVRRTRLNYEVADRGRNCAPEVADIMAGLLGWDEAKRNRELDAYMQRCDAEEAAEKVFDEAESQAIRAHHGDL